jgi:hypothetical protein
MGRERFNSNPLFGFAGHVQNTKGREESPPLSLRVLNAPGEARSKHHRQDSAPQPPGEPVCTT